MSILRVACVGFLLTGIPNTWVNAEDAGDVVDVGDAAPASSKLQRGPAGLKAENGDGSGQSTTPRKLSGGGLEKKVAVFFAGQISSIDVSNQTVVVNGNEVEQHDVAKGVGAGVADRTFKANTTCRIKTEDSARGTIKDLKTGDVVAIRFEETLRGGFKAVSMEPLAPIKKRQADEKKAQAAKDKKKRK